MVPSGGKTASGLNFVNATEDAIATIHTIDSTRAKPIGGAGLASASIL
jgi:hypothetical protein